MNFLGKNYCFTKFPTLMNLFGHWAILFQNIVLLCSAGPSKKQPMCPEVLCDEKTKCFKCFKERWFLITVFGLWSKTFALSKKNNCLGSKNPILRVQRNVLGKHFCIKKTLFFCKNISDFERKIFGLLPELFPAGLSSFNSTFVDEGIRAKFLEKKSFFLCFQTWSKNRLLEQHQNEYENFILRVRWIFFWNNILFIVIWYNFSCISSETL